MSDSFDIECFPSSQRASVMVVVVMVWYDMFYLLQMGFHPVAVVGKLVQK